MWGWGQQISGAYAAAAILISACYRFHRREHLSPSARRFLFVVKGFGNIGWRRMIPAAVILVFSVLVAAGTPKREPVSCRIRRISYSHVSPTYSQQLSSR